jgi:hypothetical protein
MPTLNEGERKILEIMSKNLLLTKAEISYHLSKEGYDSVDDCLRSLMDMDLVQKVESLGVSFVITQKGLKMVKG